MKHPFALSAHIKAWLTLVLITMSSTLLADSLLNGAAIHSELGKEMFVGALYTDQLSSNPQELLTPGTNKRLEVRVLAKRLSTRRLNGIWIEGMAINNSPDTLTAQAENMVIFTSLLRGKRLTQGDILSIRSIANEGTVFDLNGVELGRIDADNFGNLLLSSWVGSVPLSSDFRQDILKAGEVSDELLTRLEETTPSADRRQQVASWTSPNSSTNQPSTNTIAAAPIAAPALTEPTVEQPLIAAPVLAAAEPTPETTVATEATEASTTVTESADPAPSSPSETDATAAVTEEASPEPQVANADISEEAVFDEEEFIDEELEEAPALTVESLLSRQLYHSELLKWTYKHIRYPSRAIERNQQGSVRIAVVINRNGELISTTELEGSRYNTLNRAAIKAVEKASPFPAVPAEIEGEEFAFSMPIIFRLK